MSLADEICRDVHRLDEYQLQAVAELIAEMLYEAEGDEAESAGDEPESKEGARGWYELKMIPRGNKLHGPYLYRRWREGGRLRSEYCGKPRQS